MPPQSFQNSLISCVSSANIYKEERHFQSPEYSICLSHTSSGLWFWIMSLQNQNFIKEFDQAEDSFQENRHSVIEHFWKYFPLWRILFLKRKEKKQLQECSSSSSTERVNTLNAKVSKGVVRKMRQTPGNVCPIWNWHLPCSELGRHISWLVHHKRGDEHHLSPKWSRPGVSWVLVNCTGKKAPCTTGNSWLWPFWLFVCLEASALPLPPFPFNHCLWCFLAASHPAFVNRNQFFCWTDSAPGCWPAQLKVRASYV